MLDTSHRVLVIDDNPWIHDDVRKVLSHRDEDRELARLERELGGGADDGGEPAPRAAPLRFEIDSARQGREGVEAARRALGDGRPYAIAFVDIRMPPGWDGIETIERLWEVDPDVHAVICSAYSDFSWSAIQRRIGGTDRLLVLKKPFDAVEIAQLAHTLARKWSLYRVERRRAAELEALVDAIGGAVRAVGDALQVLRAWYDELAPASPSATIPAALDAASDGLGRLVELARATRELGRGDPPAT